MPEMQSVLWVVNELPYREQRECGWVMSQVSDSLTCLKIKVNGVGKDFAKKSYARDKMVVRKKEVISYDFSNRPRSTLS